MNPVNKYACSACCAATLIMAPALVYAADDCSLPNNVRVLIGSKSPGGDTYQAASIVTKYLSNYLDVNMKVDPVGAIPGFRILKRSSRPGTFMIFHDQSYLGHIYGVSGYVDPFKTFDIGPTLTINPGNAYLVPKKSPYHTVNDVIKAAGHGKTVKIAIQPGGVSEIGFSAIKNAVKLKYPGKQKNITPVYSGSQSDKNMKLFHGYANVINGTVQADGQFTNLSKDDKKAMRFIWLTSKQDTIKKTKAKGYAGVTRKQMLQYTEPKVSVPLNNKKNFNFDKEFFILYNKKTDPKLEKCINNALKSIYKKGKIKKALKSHFFVPDYRSQHSAEAHLKSKRNTYKNVIHNVE
jgi:tripartite-type tricarboxylate transporter receptor subunit TctC